MNNKMTISPEVLESYDGDAKDLQPSFEKEQAEVKLSEQEILDHVEPSNLSDFYEKKPEEKAKVTLVKETEWNRQTDSQITAKLVTEPQVNQQPHQINPNDPHYTDYRPDQYYEYGVGEEPKMPHSRIQSGEGAPLAIVSAVLGSLSLFNCGSLITGIVAIILGIIVLTKKNYPKYGKILGIVGISLGTLSIFFCVGIIIYSAMN